MKLQPITDNCPKTDRMCDMRRCCGRGGIPACEHYGAEPWSEFAEVTCLHAAAKTNTPEQRAEAWSAIKAGAGVAHVTLCG